MLSRTLTMGLATAAALTFAGPAQAVVVDTDRPKLTGAGYDFGTDTLVAGSPTGGGRLKFDVSNTQIRPRLTGTLHIDDADGTCARMKLVYRDEDDDALGDPTYGGTKCVDDDRHHEYDVDLDSFSDGDIAEVEVTLQRKTASGWSTVESEAYSPNAPDDKVKVTEDGVDFGDDSWGAGAPGGSGLMDWDMNGSEVEPRLVGALHLNNSTGLCARMNLRYYTEDGLLLTSRADEEKCADDNGHHWWTIDFRPHASNKIAEVKVQLQTQGSNGSWNVAGSKTVSIEE